MHGKELDILNEHPDILMKKLQTKFTDDQQQLFVQSFLMYLNHHQETAFVIDLDNVWQWIGFSRKDPAKKLLEKHFERDVDYKIELQQALERKNEGGFNKETILMNIKTFKIFCLKAGTKKADEIHDYYITMEEILHECVLEVSYRKSKLAAERALIESHRNKSVNYFATIGNIDGDEAGKFGESDDLHTRVTKLKRELGDSFFLECVVECEKNGLLEKKFKEHPEIIRRRFKAVINGKMQTELIRLDQNFGKDEVNKIYNALKEQIHKEIDKEMRHKERMLELNIELKKLEVQSQQIQLQSQQMQLQSQSLQARPSQARPPRARPPQPPTQSQPQSVRRKSGAIKVSQYSLDGQFIKTHNSFVEAAKAVHGNRKTLSDRCASGQAYLDFIWGLAE